VSLIYIWIGACLKQYCGVGNFAPICQDHNRILFSIHATKELKIVLDNGLLQGAG
jgi:hypothetical protein